MGLTVEEALIQEGKGEMLKAVKTYLFEGLNYDAIKSRQELLIAIMYLRFHEVPETFMQKVRAIRHVWYLDILLDQAHCAKIDELERVIDKVAQTIDEYWIRKAEERGERRGALKGTRAAILQVLQIRFDSVPESILKKVKSIRSMNRLTILLRQAAVAQSIDEIELH